MREALHIFVKDVRHLWPWLAVWLALLAVFGWVDASMPSKTHVPPAFTLLIFLSLVALFSLIALGIHGEELTGNRQYWITRPFSAKGLLLAKVLFILAFVNLPILLEQSMVLTANGLPPFGYLPRLLYVQAGVLVLGGLAAAAATITRDLYGFAFVVISSGAGVAAISSWLQKQFPHGPLPARFENGLGQAGTFLTILICGVICWLQYSRRTRMRSAQIYVGLLLGAALFPWIVPRDAAQAFVLRHSPAIDSSVARLSLDAARDHGPGRGRRGRQALYIPIDLSGIPPGMEVLSERVAIHLTAPDGGTLYSAADGYNLFSDGQEISDRPRPLPGNGKYWLHMDVPETFDHPGSTPLHLRVTVKFELLRAQPISPNVFCNVVKLDEGSRFVRCMAPFQHPAMVIRYPSQDGRMCEDTSFFTDSWGPLSVWTVASLFAHTSSSADLAITTRETVGHYERVLDAGTIRLEDYIR